MLVYLVAVKAQVLRMAASGRCLGSLQVAEGLVDQKATKGDTLASRITYERGHIQSKVLSISLL